MNAPICPVHNLEMKVSKFGGFYCTAQNDDESYCKHKIKGGPPTSIAKPSPVVPSGDILAAAALNFGASLYRGAGSADLGEDAIKLAIRAYQAMRAIE